MSFLNVTYEKANADNQSCEDWQEILAEEEPEMAEVSTSSEAVPAQEKSSYSLTRLTPYKSAQRRWSLNFAKSQKTSRPYIAQKKFRLSIDDNMNSKLINIEQITQDFEDHADLMEDSELAKAKRVEMIRSLPQTLSIKREIREKLTKTVRHRSCSSFYEHSCERAIMNKLKLGVAKGQAWWQQIRRWEIWYDSLKEVEGHFGSGICGYFKFLRFLLVLNVLTLAIMFSFITLPQMLFLLNTEEVSAMEFWQATLFYGSYTNATVTLIDQSSYNMPKAFVITTIVIYALIFLIISTSVGHSYRHSFIESSGLVHNLFSHKIFYAWDFGISNPKAAEMKRRAILSEFRELLRKITASNDERTSNCHRIWTVSSQLAANILCLFMLCGLSVALWSMLTFCDGRPEWEHFLVPLLINLTLTLYQNIFLWISKLEEYTSPGTTLHVYLLRNFFLQATVVVVLLVYRILDDTQDSDYSWETQFGIDLNRIAIADLFLTCTLIPAYYAGRYGVHRLGYLDIPRFDISHACLKLIFNQTLMWMGLVYAPMLPMLIVVKMVIVFYIKKHVAIRFCKPPEKLWRSSQTQTTFMVLTFLSLFAVIVINSFIAIKVQTSNCCGPFRNFDHMIDPIGQEIDSLKDTSTFWAVVASISKPAVVAGILLSMCVVVYYLRARSEAHVAMVKMLKEMLYLEGRDKKFLISNIKKLTQEAGFLFDDSEVPFTRHYRTPSSDWMYSYSLKAHRVASISANGSNNTKNNVALTMKTKKKL